MEWDHLKPGKDEKITDTGWRKMATRKGIVSSLTVLFGMIFIIGFFLSGAFVYLYFFALLIACASFLQERLTRKEWLHEGIAFILFCGVIYAVEHLVF